MNRFKAVYKEPHTARQVLHFLDLIPDAIQLRIDNSGWSVNCTGPINEVWTGCSQRTYNILHIPRYPKYNTYLLIYSIIK